MEIPVKALEVKYPTHPEPPTWIAECLFQFSEFHAAARKFSHAASLSTDREKVRPLLRSAQALKRAKKYEEVRKLVLEQILSLTVGSTLWLDAIDLVYDVFKLLNERHQAFALAEHGLRQNPGHKNLRFTLGLDYLSAGLNELAICHFHIIVQSDPKNYGASHNLALGCSESGLPIMSVAHYKSAIPTEIVRIPVESSGSGFHMLSSSGNAGNSFL